MKTRVLGQVTSQNEASCCPLHSDKRDCVGEKQPKKPSDAQLPPQNPLSTTAAILLPFASRSAREFLSKKGISAAGERSILG
jgi:hypothetical protein